MTSFLLLGGPSHAQIVEVPVGDTLLRPAGPSIDDMLAGRLEPADPAAQVTYRRWSLADRVGLERARFDLMVADNLSDLGAMLLFRDMIERFYDKPERERVPRQEAGLQELLAAMGQYIEEHQ